MNIKSNVSMFESSVILYGSKTNTCYNNNIEKFESSVILYVDKVLLILS